MIWKQSSFDELDEILIAPTDEPVPEGKEQISEKDFDLIRQGLDDFDDNPLTII